ncbi:MAG: hypothetical protein MZV63_57925 [Marinilabiliales bacterium]|nr:hypothetical protein [Marinilabiliales bacterium]
MKKIIMTRTQTLVFCKIIKAKPYLLMIKGAEPLQLGVLAGITPDDIEVKLYDDRLEDIDYSENADLVAISVEIFTAKRAYEIADEYRKLKVPVILEVCMLVLLLMNQYCIRRFYCGWRC